MNNEPLVSIIIPVYNGANYLSEAIDSALSQTYQNIEVLVINDGSKDENATKNIALDYGSKIRYFEKENGGVASALNLGVKEMRGEYFSWLSHDDAYLPNKIEAQLRHLQRIGDNKSIIYSDFLYMDENSQYISDFRVAHIEPEAFKIHFVLGGIIHGCTLLIPAECFKICGYFRTDLRTTQDYDLWFRFADKYRFIHIPEILVKSRQHAQQDTHKLKPIVIKECNDLEIHFLKSIKKKEIIFNYSKPLPIYYLDFAISMTKSGFIGAGKYACYLGMISTTRLTRQYFREFISKLSFVVKVFFKKNN
jgi:glycosyltransferase involved in cell wall biosynthesis